MPLPFLSNLFRPGDRGAGLPVEGRAPSLDGAGPWFNTPEPLTLAGLKGRVVLLDFWTYSCVNCLRTLPYLRAWHERYAPHGLTIIGVHTPEFPFERDSEIVRRAVARLGLTYPVVLDADYAVWNRYGNRYWPAHYFVDMDGNLRARHFGEGGYAESERTIRELLTEAGHDLSSVPLVSDDLPEQAAPHHKLTPETYLGFDRQEYLGSPESLRLGAVQRYSCPPQPSVDIFYLCGAWRLDNAFAEATEAGAGITYRVRAASVNLVLAGPVGAKIEVCVDGREPAADECGADLKREGARALVTLDEPRLYELVRGPYGEHLLEITCLSPGVQTYAFTFG
jgi:thiol-disulfide isomerase/thioredoxin